MQVTAEQLDPCTLELNIELEADEVSRTFESVYREFSRYVNVPGFRPGKAPRSLVERYVESERVNARAKEKVVSDFGAKAIQEHEVEPFRNPSVDAGDLQDKAPFSFKVTLPLEPQITLGEYTNITVERPVFPITDEMIERRIERLQNERARLERVTDRTVEAGDVLIAEVSAQAEGEEPAKPRRQLVQLDSAPPGFDAAVLGMAIDEERDFDLTFPEDYEDENVRGKTLAYHVKLASISAKRVPELTDEFAKQVAGVETVDALRQQLRDRMEAEVKRLSDQMAEQRIIEEILNRAEIYYPVALVREEIEDAYRQLSAELRQSNTPYQQWLESNGLTAETHQQAVAEQSEQRVRAILVLRQIAIQENIQASEEAIDAEFANLLAQGRLTEEQHEEWIGDNRRRLMVANALIQQSLHDFLFANNILTDVAQGGEPDPDELAEANAEADDEAAE